MFRTGQSASQTALGELTNMQREIIYLKYYGGMDNKGIAEVTRCRPDHPQCGFHGTFPGYGRQNAEEHVQLIHVCCF